MRRSRIGGRGAVLTLGLGLALGLATPGGGQEDAAEPAAREEPEPEASQERAEETREPREAETMPVYIPPSRGATKVRVGAATRGERRDVPALTALAPDHVAYTTQAQPVLCWYLSEATETRIDLALQDDRSVEPLLEFTVPVGTPPGMHSTRLSDHGVTLEEGVVYLWFVSLVPDAESRSNDVIASGAVERVEPDPELVRELAAAPASEAWRIYARHGIWYDALALLSARIESDPADRTLRDARRQLLEQVELPRAAAYDREALGS